MVEVLKNVMGREESDKKSLFQLVTFEDKSITDTRAYDYLQRLKGKYNDYVNNGKTYWKKGKIVELSPLTRAYFAILEHVIGPDDTKDIQNQIRKVLG